MVKLLLLPGIPAIHSSFITTLLSFCGLCYSLFLADSVFLLCFFFPSAGGCFSLLKWQLCLKKRKGKCGDGTTEVFFGVAVRSMIRGVMKGQRCLLFIFGGACLFLSSLRVVCRANLVHLFHSFFLLYPCIVPLYQGLPS